ncbi:MAG: HlyD family efflux transporter periplasmic adaptor subunit [Pirellulales bacterium]|nr:HlyD family efflux transporter periplasmic adaptor subunit [Planctomycetales bacterium]
MSTEQSIDPELIEQTRQQIRGLVNEIAQLAKTDSSPEEFFHEFLGRVVTALAAVGGAVWISNENGQLELQHHINLKQIGLGGNGEQQLRHLRLLRKVANSREGTLVPPHTADEAEQAENPTDYLLVLGPLTADQELHGIVEVFQRPSARPTTQRGYLRFLAQMCDLAAEYLKTRKLRSFTDRQTLWNQLEQFTRSVHTSLDPIEAAFTIANEGRRLIGCDRVSLAMKRGSKCRVEAVSGQDLFDKRSNTIVLLNRLATAVVRTGEPMWYTGDTTNMAPQVEDAVQEYVDDTHSKMVAVLPLLRGMSLEEQEDEDSKHKRPEAVGALIIEQIEDARLRDGTKQRVQVVCDHSATAMANAIDYHSLFLMPLWRALGRMTWIVRARTLPKTLAVVLAVAAVLTALIVVPADFNLSAPGNLQPDIRRDVFAQLDGEIEEVLVEDGTAVDANQVLAKMSSRELDQEIETYQGTIAALGEQINALGRARSDERSQQRRGDRSSQAASDVSGEISELRIQQASNRRLLEIAREKRQLLSITSPIAGEVDEWDVQNMLLSRPVNRGDRLMRVVDPTGEWVLEVRMPEKRMGFINAARLDQGDDLLVTYVSQTDPSRSFEGRVISIENRANVESEEGNIVMIRVAIDKEDIGSPRPGAEVTAKVYCGKKPIGYVWLHDLIAWIQTKWFEYL